MKNSKTAKPATADTVNGLQEIEQLGSELSPENNLVTRELQARRLCRLHAFTLKAAIALAPFVFAGGRR